MEKSNESIESIDAGAFNRAGGGGAGAELDEKTPHFLNPAIFRKSEPVIDVAEEELAGETVDARDAPDASPINTSPIASRPPDHPAAVDSESAPTASIPAEQLEAVLNQGMAFLNSLAQAATGKPLFDGSTNRKTVEVDKETGEVVLRFKL